MGFLNLGSGWGKVGVVLLFLLLFSLDGWFFFF